jgi:hypothetical protein
LVEGREDDWHNQEGEKPASHPGNGRVVLWRELVVVMLFVSPSSDGQWRLTSTRPISGPRPVSVGPGT